MLFGISFAEAIFQQEGKEVKQMKNAKALLAALILLGTTGGTALAASDGVISKEKLTPDSYCNEKFPAIIVRSLLDPLSKYLSRSNGSVRALWCPLPP